ncbi:hypothetical protein FA15DRAFT_695825 [Coprinopsis marcescibilis]|uniref:G-protein coupled receptors family 1 profile domain-containing protein n=1 Tax=Coprinopsis marcescibilis TaxID=230819 RepID=A0A5C3KPN5_COPMA|nr:hypothetical protein FA15DRAFT_695825 [Coprinopsis marcescibilis]
MSPVWTEEYVNQYGLVSAKSEYASYIITMTTIGIQLFMNGYALIIFFETPSERRQGRSLYLITGWLIFLAYTLGACVDFLRSFEILMKTSHGQTYMQIRDSTNLWMDSLGYICRTLVFLMGDGLLLFRCYLVLSVDWLWILALPVVMYLSVTALGICTAVLNARYSDPTPQTTSMVGLSWDIMTFATNVLITSMLCYRLLASHRDLAKSMPEAGKRLAVYRTAVRILVEAALPLAIVGIINAAIAIVPFATRNGNITGYVGNTKALAGAVKCVALIYYALQALAPQIIIFRVTTGRSWTKTDKSSAEALSRSLAFGGSQPEESHISGRLTRDDEEIAEECRPDPATSCNVGLKAE